MKFDDVQHLLPESARLLVSLIGLRNTVKLVETLGGTSFPVALRKNRQGEIRYEMLAEVVGVDAANILTRHFGNDMLYIPLCKTALRELFYREVRAEFDRITQEFSALHAVATLASKYRMSDRQIWRVLKKQDDAGNAPEQQGLF